MHFDASKLQKEAKNKTMNGLFGRIADKTALASLKNKELNSQFSIRLYLRIAGYLVYLY